MKRPNFSNARFLAWSIIVAPFVLGLLYYYVVAANRYVSISVITVRSHQEQASLPGAAMLLAGVTPPARDDTLILREYIHSLRLLKRMDETLKLRPHYESERVDPLFRLYPGATQEWLLEYFRSRVEVVFDDASGLLTLRVQGFTPEFAQALNVAILKDSERIVNQFSQQMAEEQVDFADAELQKAASRVQAARGTVLAFQTKNRLLDPVAQAQAAGAVTTDLQASLARLEAELKNITSYLSEDAFQVKTTRSQIAAIKGQINAERLRATSGSSPERLNALAAEFQVLTAQAGFADDAYKLALAATESIRIETTRKVKSLVVIEPPTLPETAAYPRRFYNLMTLLIASCLVYSITRLVLATIREHQD